MDEAPLAAKRHTAKEPPGGQTRQTESQGGSTPWFSPCAFRHSLWSLKIAWRLSSRAPSQIFPLRGQWEPNDRANVAGQFEQVGLHPLVHPLGADLEGE